MTNPPRVRSPWPSPDASAPSDQGSESEKSDGRRRPRRRGSRGGRRRKAAAADSEGKASESSSASESAATSGSDSAAASDGVADQDAATKRGRKAKATRGRSAIKSSSRKRSGAASAAESSSDDSAEAVGESAAAKKRSRKRGTRGGRRRKGKATTAVEIEFIPGEEDDLPELAELPDEAILLADSESETSAEGKRGRGKRTRAKTKTKAKTKAKSKKTAKRERSGAKKTSRRKAEEETTEIPVAKSRKILVNAGDPEETRVAVVEDGRVSDLQMTVKKHASYVSDIYRGRVVNLEPAIGAAFVDFGQGRNGFLHASDVLPVYAESDWSLDKLLSTPVPPEDLEADAEGSDDDEKDEKEERATKAKAKGRRQSKGRPRRVRRPIDKLVKKGQLVCVQITKDAIGDKGPTLTTYISIPGRYLVLMPSLERTGVSRKIDDDKERRRLKRILSSLEIPEGMGVIVRTAGGRQDQDRDQARSRLPAPGLGRLRQAFDPRARAGAALSGVGRGRSHHARSVHLRDGDRHRR